MKKYRYRAGMFFLWLLILLTTTPTFATVDFFGYLESEAMGQIVNQRSYLLEYNKLRLDLQKRLSENVFIGADFIYIDYNGDRSYDLRYFLPDRLDSYSGSYIPRYLVKISYDDTLILDNAYMQFSYRALDITMGRQQLSLGTGYAWNPTDLFNFKTLIDPTYEQPGHNAVRFDLMLGQKASFLAIWEMHDESKNSTVFGRLKIRPGGGRFEFSAVGAKARVLRFSGTRFVRYQDRIMVGTDFVGEIAGVGVWGEAAWNDLEFGGDYIETLIGCDYTFDFQTYFLFEYFHNGQGEKYWHAYGVDDWLLMLGGYRKSLGRDFIFSYWEHPFHDLINGGFSIIGNLNDASLMINPRITWYPFQDVETILTGSLNPKKDGTEFGTFDPSGFIRVRVSF